MSWPLSQDFNEAVQHPATAFSDPGLKGGSIVTGPLGVPRPRSGNYADVYEVRAADGSRWAVKCFTRPTDAGMADRYAAVDKHLKSAALPFAVGFAFLPDGVRVKGKWYPAVKMQWVDGFPLNQFVRDNLGRATVLEHLLQLWVRLCRRLRETGMAHGDLQHGNVLLVPADAGKSTLGLKLVDYDGMFVPALAGQPTGELGHASYQHPARAAGGVYSPDLDRFPHLVVATALRAVLVGGRDLWDRYDTGDNLLFTEADFKDPGRSRLMRELWDTGDPFTVGLLAHLLLGCRKPMAQVPWLDQLTDGKQPPALTPSQERQAVEVLGRTAAGTEQDVDVPPVPAAREPVPLPDFPARPAAAAPPPAAPAVVHHKKGWLLTALGAGALTFAAIAAGVVLLVNGTRPEDSNPPPEPTAPTVATVPDVVPPPPQPLPQPVNVPSAPPAAVALKPAVPALAAAGSLPLALFDNQPVTELALDPSGAIVFAVGGGKLKAVTATGAPLFQYAPPAGTLGHIWAAPGKLIAETKLPGGKAELRFLDPRTGRPVPPDAIDIASDQPALHVAVAPDGSRAAVVKANGHVALFDLSGPRGAYYTLHPDQPPVSAHLPAGGQKLLVGYPDQVRVHLLTELNRYKYLKFGSVKPRLDVQDVAADAARLAHRHDDKLVLKQLGEGWPTPAVALDVPAAAAVRLLADGRRAAVADAAGLTVYDADTGAAVGRAAAAGANPRGPALAVTPDGATAAFAHRDGVLVVRTGLTPTIQATPSASPQLALADVAQFQKEDLGDRPRFAVTDRSGQLLYASLGNEVKAFEAGAKTPKFVYPPGGTPQQLWPTLDGRLVVRVRAGTQTELHQLNGRTGAKIPGGVLNVTPTKPQNRLDIAVSADGTLAAVAASGEVTVFDLKTGKPAGKKPCPAEVRAAAFTHPPTKLVLGTDTGAAAASPLGPDAFAPFGPVGEMVRLADVASDAGPLLFRSTVNETSVRLSLVPFGGAGERVGLTALSVADPRLTAGGRAVAYLADNTLEVVDALTGKPVARRTGFGVPAQLRATPGGGTLTAVWADTVAVYRVTTGSADEAPAVPAAAARPVPPDADAATKAIEKVREAFKAEYARKLPADRRKLTDRLLAEADTAADPVTRYALLREAAAAAAEVPDPALAMRAFDGVEDTFEADTAADRQAALEAMTKASTQAGVLKAAAEAALELADTLAERDEYDRAVVAAKLAADWLTRTGQTNPARDAAARADALLAQKAAFAPVKAAAEALKANPTDAAAAATVGRFRCFVQRRWEDGLPLLAAGADETLKAIAALDLKGNQDGNAPDLERGEAWDRFARSAPAADKPAAEARARYWYARALAASRPGVDRALAEAKLAFTVGTTEFKPGVLCEAFGPGNRRRIGRIDQLIDALGRSFDTVDKNAVRVRWSGRLLPPTPGRYKLIVESADPVTVKVGPAGEETERIKATGKGGEAFVRFGEKPLSLVVQWDTKPGDARNPHALTLKWLPPGAKNPEPIPPAAFYWPSTDKAKLLAEKP